MLTGINAYMAEVPGIKALAEVKAEGIAEQLRQYLESYADCFVRSQQKRYFTAFVKGLLSNLDRKSIEPIALSFLDEKDVRGMQQFFTRSRGWDEAVSQQYKYQLAQMLTEENGFLSVDESDFVKKGNESAGVARQYCGRLGKRENCQAGVFTSYASDKGVGLIDSRLYLPEKWFGEDFKQKREDCQISEGTTFKTKNELAKEMVNDILQSRVFEIQCIGCDASFGSDHTFLDSLPESMYYFASVRENEHIFRVMPKIIIPENIGKGGRYKHPRSTQEPISIKTILDDETIPWMNRVIAEGTKGPVIAEVKCLRAVSCRKENRLYMPKSEIWVYIRKYEDGAIKYFISNMPDSTDIHELDRLATARWSIEQCFQECKSYLGMTHYETRSYRAWHRHMVFVMIAQLFVTVLRDFLKEAMHYPDHADGEIHHRVPNTNPDKDGTGSIDCTLSLAS